MCVPENHTSMLSVWSELIPNEDAGYWFCVLYPVSLESIIALGWGIVPLWEWLSK